MHETPLTICGAILFMALGLAGCSTATSRAQLKPSDVVTQLVRFHGDVADQFQAGGMELEHFLIVMSWIGDEIRVLQTNPKQWEGQARLDWRRVRNICVPFERLEPAVKRIDALMQ